MKSLDQLRSGLEKAWDQLSDNWQQFYHQAAQALTRFTPRRHQSHEQLETHDDQLIKQSSRWGLLAAEVLDSDSEVIVKLEIPGMSADDFDIKVVDDTLVISGEKHVQREQQHGQYYFTERAYGQFERALPLPAAVDDSKAKATYKRGVLQIRLPKTAESHKRRINVQTH